MTRRNDSTHPLTDLQQAILDYVWANGPVSSEAIRQALQRKHPLKDSSMRTLLRRLEARALLTHRIEGKVFLYEAALPPQQVAAGALRHILHRFFAGSVEQMLVGMVDQKVLSAGDLERLARKVRSRK
ncbi:MAG TPA: BlaI/MecI/CopY family transcriptional regulator [Vicinamibacterales bacterium]|nr:BlaI/MecI/CopY family transcriptional regulator [Vicinamibacterales bacterium]